MYAGLFGVETEYAVSGDAAHGGPVPRGQILEDLLRDARQQLAHLPDGSAGMFLQNGARFYIDCGGHPEFTTPECNDPVDLVRYVRAGEAILLRLTEGAPVNIFRSNVDYAQRGTTWGSHESYLYRHVAPKTLPRQLLPHLVSRVIYTGAGGFNSLSAGLEFTLSPRVPFLGLPVSHTSTGERGIFHDKDERLAPAGFHRLHLLCGESLCTERALWLRIATTALVVALCDAGFTPGEGVTLRNPVEAMHTFADDPTCRSAAATSHGPTMTAVAIQRHYLEQVEAHLADRFVPPWAAEVCHVWRTVLDALEAHPPGLATTLDWAIKHALYTQHLDRRGLTWEAIHAWSALASRLAAALAVVYPDDLPELRAEAILGTRSPIANVVHGLTPTLREHGLYWDDLARFLAVRLELLEIDTRFGQLGRHGIFTALDQAGVLTHRVTTPAAIERATMFAPKVGRARLRGAHVRGLSGHGDRFLCTWEGVWDGHQRRIIDLVDPFTRRARWTPLPAGHPLGRFRDFHRHEPDPVDLNQRALDLRKQNQLEQAERLLRQAILVEDRQVAVDSPKRPHRRNNLAIVLLRMDRLPAARRVNQIAWQLKRGRHDLTSGRILFVRIALRLLNREADISCYLGQLKTLLSSWPLPCWGDIATTWDIPDVLMHLRARLPGPDAALLVAVAETLNDNSHLRRLEEHPRWREAAHVPLDTPWTR